MQQIAAADAQFGGQLQPAASAEALVALYQQVQERFGYHLPAAYGQLLAIADGVDFNGYTLYASQTQPLQGTRQVLQGFVEINKFWREYADNQDHHLLMFGETGDDLYLLDQRTHSFQLTDKVSGDIYQAFATFEEIVEQLLRSALGLEEAS
ncbi:MAG: YrhA family protein [Janthinobacterium lividum]